MTTFTVISADIITKKGVTPFVGLTVNVNGKQEQIARTTKQMLLDLHKSARGSNIPSGLLDNGIDNANPLLVNQFRAAVIGLVGKTGLVDVEFYEAGSEYIATEDSTAVKEGNAQVGDTLYTEKKGSRVEGFINFPLSDMELAQQQLLQSNPMMAFQALFGIKMEEKQADPEKARLEAEAKAKADADAEAKRLADESHKAAFGGGDEEFPTADELAKAKAEADAKAKAKTTK